MLPIITMLAPTASAFTACPVEETPPSAITGTPNRRATRAVLYTAEACARPTAHTSCVVQMEPMPMPTRRPSTPLRIRWYACRAVTTLPPTTSTSGCVALIQRTRSCWYMESPWEESITIRSAPASTSAEHRSRSLGRVPMLPPTSSCLAASRLARGKSRCFFRSLREISATSPPAPSTTGSLPFLDRCRTAFASFKSTPCGAVTNLSSGVMTAESGVVWSSTKSMSRLLTMPTNLAPISPFSVTGIPLYPYLNLISSTSAIVWFGERQ
mmetsp:Transcript_16856/g.26251  ORF Transcript_16856/g.26251 Transcript_16856/m.26251 type:complete len:269 (+) Transcript_16856:636-1442(+)